MSENLEDAVDNSGESSRWVRILFMLGFAIGAYVVLAPIIAALTIVQILFVLISGESNANLRHFGTALTDYVAQILAFLSYNSDLKPFPFTSFPAMEKTPAASGAQKAAAAAAGKSANRSSGKTAAARSTPAAAASDETAEQKPIVTAALQAAAEDEVAESGAGAKKKAAAKKKSPAKKKAAKKTVSKKSPSRKSVAKKAVVAQPTSAEPEAAALPEDEPRSEPVPPSTDLRSAEPEPQAVSPVETVEKPDS